MDAEYAANWPHVPTAAGRLVKVKNREGRTFRVQAAWVAYQDAKPRNAYIVLEEANGESWVILNGWLTPFDWLAHRQTQLLAAQTEMNALHAALRGE